MLKKIGIIFDRLETFMAVVAGTLLVFMMFTIAYDVVMRYFFSKPTIWAGDFSRFILLYVAFLGAAWLLKLEGHVTLDLFIMHLKPGARVFLNMITSVVGAITCLVIVIFGIISTMDSIQLGYRIETVTRTPQFLILVVIPFGSFFFFVRFLRRFYGYLMEWRAPATGMKETLPETPTELKSYE